MRCLFSIYVVSGRRSLVCCVHLLQCRDIGDGEWMTLEGGLEWCVGDSDEFLFVHPADSWHISFYFLRVIGLHVPSSRQE